MKETKFRHQKNTFFEFKRCDFNSKKKFKNKSGTLLCQIEYFKFYSLYDHQFSTLLTF